MEHHDDPVTGAVTVHRRRLPVPVDLPALVEEVLALPAEAWIPHFNLAVYTGDWSGVSLRSPGGRADRIYPDPAGAEPWADTVWLDACPAARAVLASLPCPVHAARLLRLGPGASVREHNDPGLCAARGEARLHVPVLTNPSVGFWLEGEPVDLAPGECWYLDLDRPHRLANDGTTPRVHLVVDTAVDDWLAGLLADA